MTLLKPKDWVTDDYQVEKYLGEGAFAEVYRVSHRFLGRQALKVFKSSCEDLEELRTALSEAILLSRIGHSNIVRVFNAGLTRLEGETHGFFTMEYVSGGTLDQYRRSKGDSPLTVEEAISILRQAATGLTIAHEEKPPIIHRDIKPQNILVSLDQAQPKVKLGDFGLAKAANPLTLMLSARGTLCYKAPEAFENADSAAGDVWALGCVVYYLLADRHPFHRAAIEGTMVRRTDMSTYRPPSRFNIEVPEAIDYLVEKCLEFDPSKRIADAGELLKGIDEACSNGESASTKDSTDLSEPRPQASSAEADQGLIGIFELAKRPQHLQQAAELLDQWIGRNPNRAERYEGLVRLWRNGISQ